MSLRASSIALDGYAYKIGVCAVMLMCVTSCAFVPVTQESTIDIGDGGFLTEEPCGPPCFWGIVPGQTREAEVIEILQERGVFETCEAYDKEAEGGSRGIQCGSGVLKCGAWVSIGFKRGTDVVAGVGFNPSSTITVQDVVAKYGEPEGVLLLGVGVHVIDVQLVMVYPGMLTRVRLPFQDKAPYILEPSTPVESIGYAVRFGEISYHKYYFSWKEWQGYGEYDW